MDKMSVAWLLILISFYDMKFDNCGHPRKCCYHYHIWAACVQLAHASLGDWKDLFVTHAIIVNKFEVSNFPVVAIFSVVVFLRRLYHDILLYVTYIYRKHWDFFSLFMCSLWRMPKIRYSMARWSIAAAFLECRAELMSDTRGPFY